LDRPLVERVDRALIIDRAINSQLKLVIREILHTQVGVEAGVRSLLGAGPDVFRVGMLEGVVDFEVRVLGESVLFVDYLLLRQLLDGMIFDHLTIVQGVLA